jgi:23S rRNA (uridine2552-2'-O)-methyltransferase
MTGIKSDKPKGRQRTVRVKTAKKRSVSSARWLERQLNDPYVTAAKSEGYRSRAAFKLIELDKKFKLLRPGLRVVDLGAAPGGWTQIALGKISDGKKSGKIVGLDILPIMPIDGAILIQKDFTEDDAADLLKNALGGPADLVMSDMAAPTTGHPATDHIRIMALAELAYNFASEVLVPGGVFICKLFQGGSEKTLLNRLKLDFKDVRHAKPPSSRQESSETYLVATGFRKTLEKGTAKG